MVMTTRATEPSVHEVELAPTTEAPPVLPRRRRRPPPHGAERRVLLEQRAIAGGEVWARQARQELLSEGRRAAGGWPGTMSEARARVAQFVLPWMTSEGMVAASSAETEQAARTLYASARSTWLSQRDHEEMP